MQRCSRCKKELVDSCFGYNAKGDLFRTCCKCRENQKNRRANSKPVIRGVYDNSETTTENETTDDSEITP